MRRSLQLFLKVTLPFYLLLLFSSPALARDYGPPESSFARFLAGKFMAFIAGIIAVIGVGCFVTGGGRSEEGEKRLLIGIVCMLIAGAMFFFRFHVWRASYTGH